MNQKHKVAGIRQIKRWCVLLPCSIVLTYIPTLSCDNATEPAQPHLYDMTQLAGKRFAAYVSPDRRNRPDTIAITWKFRGYSFASQSAWATVDSGRAWFSLPNMTQENAGSATLRWVAADDTSRFSCFGEKGCVICISVDEEPQLYSDTFVIIGPQPLKLDYPAQNDQFSMDDTITIKYRVNSDRISHIRVFFASGVSEEWREIPDATTLREQYAAPLCAYETVFIPAQWDTLISKNPEDPIRFLLKDYNSPLPGSTVISGDLTLEP